MRHLRVQKTLAKSTTVTGFGYWSGLDVTVEFRPAKVDDGIVFVRGDLPDQPRIPASVGNRIDLPLRTALAVGTASVEMVEHIMAALAGLQIDNCEVWVDRAEMPGMDGSSKAFVEALRAAGTVELAAARPRLLVTEALRVGDENNWLQAEPANDGEFFVEFQLEYSNCKAIGTQTYGAEINPASFVNELSDARTFLLEQEAQWLREQGLGRRVGYQDLLVFTEQGPIDNPLRYRDECVRHKVLDVVGDLALSGYDLVGRFTACRSGHKLNADMVRCLLQQAVIEETIRNVA